MDNFQVTTSAIYDFGIWYFKVSTSGEAQIQLSFVCLFVC